MKKLSEAVKQWLAVAEDDINGEVAHDASWTETMNREWSQGISENQNSIKANIAWDMYSKALNDGFSADQAFKMALGTIGQ